MKLLLALCLFAGGVAHASEATPSILQDLKLEPNLGRSISLDNEFTNEAGKNVRLGDFFDGKRPVILVMSYYKCPMLCGLVLNAVRDTLQSLAWLPGEKYKIVTVSFDPRDDAKLAAAKKRSILDSVANKEWAKAAEANWHFLVGKKENSAQLAKEIGFKYKWIPEEKQFAHAAAFFMISPTGKLTRMLTGIQYEARDLKLGLLEASDGKVGTITEKILLFCYHYDQKENKYSLFATRLLQVVAVAVLLAFACMYFLLYQERSEGVSCKNVKRFTI